MAAGLGFKDFTTGEVLTAADVDGYLMQGVWVFASAAARSAAVTSPQEGNYSFLKDTNSTEYYDGSTWVSAAPAGGGKVLQVVSATTTTATTITTMTLADTSITATITPTSATSTILILISGNCRHERSANVTGIGADLRRDSTTIANYNTDNYNLDLMQATGATFTLRNFNAGITFLDSPATTSAITYKLRAQVNSNANSGTSTWQFSSTPSTITLLEIGA